MKIKKILLVLVFVMLFSILWMGASVMASNETYRGDINAELQQISITKSSNGLYITGEIVVVEWVDGKSTVPEVAPKIKMVGGGAELEVFVTPTGTNTYYFDRNITGINTFQQYYFKIESGDINNISPNKSMVLDFTNTKYNNTIIGKREQYDIRILGQKIIFELNTYIGDINSELKEIKTSIANGYEYLMGEIVIVEWVDGKSTVPESKPKMRLKSKDGTVNGSMFVTPTGTNTYYFDKIIRDIDTTKEYYIEVESGENLRNISPNKSMNVNFTNTKYNNKIIGNYNQKQIRVKGQNITFEGGTTNTYIGNINSQIVNVSLIDTKYMWEKFISGEIIVVEWVDGKSTVPTQTPEIRMKSTDGEVNVNAFVTPTGTNTYYFDRNLAGLDVTKEYYFEVTSTDKLNVSPYKSMKVSFKNTEYNNKILGSFMNGWANDEENYGKRFNVKISGEKIFLEKYTYEGNINSQIIDMSLIETEYMWKKFISGEIVVVEWIDGKSTVPTKTPQIRLVSTDKTVAVDAFVTPTGTNTYYFDRNLAGLDVTKEYYIEVSSADETNVSPSKSMYTKSPYYNKILGIYSHRYQNDEENYGKDFNVIVSGQRISFEEIN